MRSEKVYNITMEDKREESQEESFGVIREPICFFCKHLLVWPRCEAFLNGIPQEIRNGENDHRQPVEGDGGIQFEPWEEEA